MSQPDTGRAERRLIEVIVGPCTRSEADDGAERIQEALDATFPKLAAAVGVRYSLPAEREHGPRHRIWACPVCATPASEGCIHEDRQVLTEVVIGPVERVQGEVREGQHYVELEFNDGLYAKLICPPSGCEHAETCGKCGRAYGDSEIEPCYDCKDAAPDECWIKTWFDNETPDGLLKGTLGPFPVDARWKGDRIEVNIAAVPVERKHEVSDAGVKRIASALDLDALNAEIGYRQTPHQVERMVRRILAAHGTSPEQPEGPSDEELTQLIELPRDLAAVLKDPSIVIFQDAAVFELIAKWQKAPCPTLSGGPRPSESHDEVERLREALVTAEHELVAAASVMRADGSIQNSQIATDAARHIALALAATREEGE